MNSNYTAAELDEFDKLTAKLSSRNQMDRIEARFDVPKFVAKHGKEKCDAMYAYLMDREDAE